MTDKDADRIVSEIADLVIADECRSAFFDCAARHIAHDDKRHELYFDVLFKALRPWERKFKTILSKLWDKELAVILANLKKIKGYRGKVADDIIDSILYPQGPFRKLLESEAKKLFISMIEERGEYYINHLRESTQRGMKAGLETSFNVYNPRIMDWIKGYVFKFSSDLETVNTKKLRRALTVGIENGETIPELMARMRGVFGEWDKYRAEIISRTETSRANNEAWVESAKQSGVVKRKEWIANPGCCDTCLDMDGMTVGLEEPFFSDDYSDGMAPPKHPACRCSIGASFED